MAIDLDDWTTLKKRLKYLKTYKKPILQRLEFGTENKIKTSSNFHVASSKVRSWAYDDSYHYIKHFNGNLYVIDELTPKLFIYSGSELEKIAELELRLKGFVEPPKDFPFVAAMTKDEYRDWFYSFSRIIDFNIRNEQALIVYIIPSNDQNIFLYRVAILNKNFTTILYHDFPGHYSSDLFYIRSNKKMFAMIKDIGEEWPKYEVSLLEW